MDVRKKSRRPVPRRSIASSARSSTAASWARREVVTDWKRVNRLAASFSSDSEVSSLTAAGGVSLNCEVLDVESDG